MPARLSVTINACLLQVNHFDFISIQTVSMQKGPTGKLTKSTMSDSVIQAKYIHMADVLRERIQQDRNSDRLPSIRSMMKRYGVSQSTITSALNILESEGLIARKGGSGVYATQNNRPITICFCRTIEANYRIDKWEYALHQGCNNRGWHLATSRFAADKVELFSDAVDADAYVVTPDFVNFQSPLLNNLTSSHIPIVVLGRDTGGARLDFVAKDNNAIIQEYVQGLVTRGHRKLAFLDCEPPFHEVKQRVDCFERACRLLNIESSIVLDVGAKYGSDSLSASAEFLRKYLSTLNGGPLPFTALLSSSASGSIPAIRVFNDAGYRVPQDLSLCCLGSDSRSIYAVPTITNTVHNHEESADAILQIIDKRLNGNTSPLLYKWINYQIEWRDSVTALN